MDPHCSTLSLKDLQDQSIWRVCNQNVLKTLVTWLLSSCTMLSFSVNVTLDSLSEYSLSAGFCTISGNALTFWKCLIQKKYVCMDSQFNLIEKFRHFL